MLDEGRDVGVVDVFLFVCQRDEVVEHFLERVVVEGVAELDDAVAEGVATGVLAEHEVGADVADVLRSHDLVGRRVLEHAVLMDACLVGEGVLADDGFVPLNLHAGDAGDQTARREQPLSFDVGGDAVVVLAGADGHHEFFQGRVARTLAEAVDRALDLPGARFDTGQAVRDGEAEVVVTVGRDDSLVDIGDVVLERLDDIEEMTGGGVADRVWDVDRRGSRFDRPFDDFAEEVEFGASSVFGRELDVGRRDIGPGGHLVDGVFHHLDRLPEDFFLRHLELVLPVDGGRGEEHVHADVLGVFEGVPGPVDILDTTAGESADGRLVAELLSNFLNRFEVAGGGDGEAGLDHVDAHLDEGFGDFHFLRRGHRAAGGLLAVAEGGVEDGDSVGHGFQISDLKFQIECWPIARYEKTPRLHGKPQGGCAFENKSNPA